ncbi:hypothetical protein TI39_contig388g00008 [Zymoseptoria brevis]|uniref:Sodium/calcium exchanger membrane region domain-containing protein n=1 Tax=Zymoseptoria brevis TaxID=1047168 RepID=A0A0F4GNK4_9PEZI|nr:hypothetical protein TI39_contig388g00008 [Zymoseptoria brevis]
MHSSTSLFALVAPLLVNAQQAYGPPQYQQPHPTSSSAPEVPPGYPNPPGYGKPPGTPYTTTIGASHASVYPEPPPKPSTTTLAFSPCAEKCWRKFNACRVEPHATQIGCVTDLAKCVGYVPADQNGDFQIPTVCSSTSSIPYATSASAVPRPPPAISTLRLPHPYPIHHPPYPAGNSSVPASSGTAPGPTAPRSTVPLSTAPAMPSSSSEAHPYPPQSTSAPPGPPNPYWHGPSSTPGGPNPYWHGPSSTPGGPNPYWHGPSSSSAAHPYVPKSTSAPPGPPPYPHPPASTSAPLGPPPYPHPPASTAPGTERVPYTIPTAGIDTLPPPITLLTSTISAPPACPTTLTYTDPGVLDGCDMKQYGHTSTALVDCHGCQELVTNHIKHKARKHAWYPDNGESETKTYNPFGRAGPRRARMDEENHITHVSTENDADQPATETRREKYEQDTADFRGPQKAGTFPQGPRGAMPVNNSRGFSGDETDQSDDAPREMYNPVSIQNDMNARKRKGAKFFGRFGKKDTSDGMMERSDTEKSQKRKHKHIPIMTQIKAVLFSWINILLIFVPIGIALEQVKSFSRIGVFVINFIAIIPLAAVLSFATEELAMYIGEVLGGLLNASFGNAVELIVSVIALKQGKVIIVQTSLIGSMLSNLLLVLGMCFFFGGLKRTEQYFNITVAQTAASLLALSIGSLIIPTAFAIFSPGGEKGVTPASRGTAVLLLVIYGCYLFFQLSTHKEIYNEPSQKVPKRPSGRKDSGDMQRGIAVIGAASGAASAGGNINRENLVHEEDDDEEEETPSLSIIGSLIVLGIATVLIAFCAEYMVSSIGALTDGGKVSEEFVGLILIPIVGNAAEHATAVTVAIKDKMDLAIGVAVGSSLQIALLVLPLMIMLNWWGVGHNPLNLDFDGFLVVVLVLSIWLVNYLINDGKSHWLEGVMLMLLYMIIAIAAWFYPDDPNKEVA